MLLRRADSLYRCLRGTVLDARHDDIIIHVAGGAGGGVIAGLVERAVKFEAVLYEALEHAETFLEVCI